MAGDPELDRGQISDYLHACLELQDLEGEIAPLIDHGRLRRYEAGHEFRERRGRPLRVVLDGRIVAGRRSGRPRYYAPGSLFGLEGVAAWAARSPASRLRAMRPAGGEVVDRALVLEIAAKDFDAAIGTTGRLRERLVAAARVEQRADEIVEALEVQHCIGNAQTDTVYHLLARGQIRRYEHGEELLAAGYAPDAYFVVLEGLVELCQPDEVPRRSLAAIGLAHVQQRLRGDAERIQAAAQGAAELRGAEPLSSLGLDLARRLNHLVHLRVPAASVGAGAVVGLDEIIGQTTMATSARAWGTALVARLERSTFVDLQKIQPDFQRAVIRGRGPRAPRIPRFEQNIGLVVAHPDLRFPELGPEGTAAPPGVLRGLVDLLAESAAVHLFDRVLVLHLVPVGSPGAGEEHWHDHQPPGHADVRVGVRHVRVPVAADQDPAEAADRALQRVRDEVDLVLIEAFALGERSDAVLSFAHFPRPFSIVHLVDRPSALPPLPLLRQARPTVTSAVLHGSPGAIGIGHVLYRITRDLRARAERSLAERIAPPALRDAAAELARVEAAAGLAPARAADRSAGSALAELGEAVRANLEITLDVIEDRLRTIWSRTEDLPPTWPLGTVRLRFSPELLAQIAARAAAPGAAATGPAGSPGQAARPIRFEDLGLDPAALAAARQVFERWARAVTWRRVGLALGGGGPYGLVHVPLLKELRRARVPLDVVSGSSVGSTVGAYFAVLGEEGLEQLIDQFLGQSLVIGPLAVLSSAFVELLIAFQVGQIDLAELDVPFIPVVTNALLGTEWDVRHGSLALGVRASGSLPPLVGPTVMGSRRYLDGGIVANVPVNVLRDEQAALVIASNPISTASPHARRFPFLAVPFVGELVRESRLGPRLDDVLRLFPMLFGTLGETQLADADVAYRPITGDEGHRRRPPIRLERDVSLQRTVNDAVTRWHRSLGNRPLLVRLSDDRRHVELISGRILFIPGRDEIDPSSALFLEDLARFLLAKPFVDRIAARVTARTRDSASARARAIQGALIAERVSPERISLEPVVGDDEAVSFPVRRLLEERSARRNIVELSRAALDQCKSGDLVLGRLLAIEAAEVAQREGERPLELDQALRAALGVPGRPLRALDKGGPGEVECLAWHPGGRWLALADDEGWVGVWDLEREDAGPAWRAHVHPGGTDPDVRAMAWSPDGHCLATCGNDAMVVVHELDLAGGGAPTARLVLGEPAGTWAQWGVGFSPDGSRLLVTWGGASSVGIFDLDGRSPAARATRHAIDVAAPVFFDASSGGGAPPRTLACSAAVLAAAWDEAGERVATAAEDGSVVVWDAATGAALATVEPHGEPAHRLAWRGERLAVASGAVARIHDTASIRLGAGGQAGEGPLTLEGHDQPLTALVFSPDGQRLLTASRDGSARIWGAARGELRMVMRGEPTPALGAAWHPDGDAVAVRTELGETWIWDAWSGERLARLSQGGEIRAASFRPDGAQLATASSDGTVCLWDPFAHGVVQRQRRRTSGHGRVQVVSADFCPGGAAQVATAWADGAVEIWHPETREVLRALGEPGAPPDKAWVAWSPDGRWIATTRRSARRPALFRADDGSPRELGCDHRLPEPARRAEVFRIHWSPDGAYLAVNYLTGLCIWDAETGEKVAEHAFADEGVQWICWHPRERGRFAFAVYRGWDSVLRGRVGSDALEPCRGGSDFAWRVAHSPDGGRIAAAHNDGAARIYDAATGAELAALTSASLYRAGQGGAVRVVAWSPDGARLAIGDGRQRIGVFQAKAGDEPALEPMDEREAHRSAITQLTWLDAARLASAGDDGTVRIWEQHDGAWTTTAAIEGYAMPVTVFAPDPERRRLITAADDGTCRVELLDPAMLVEALCALVGDRRLTDEELRRLSAGRGMRVG